MSEKHEYYGDIVFFKADRALNKLNLLFHLKSKTNLVWKPFLDSNKRFIWIKQYFLNQNKISLGQINIYLNQINFSSNKQMITFVYDQKYNLFALRQKFISFEQVYIWFQDTLFDSNKFYFIQINHFFIY